MGKSCWTKPCVRNKQGKIVDSKLWKDLYQLTGKNHNDTLRLYRIAVNEKFIDSVSGLADFDENGQITARSFLSLSGRGYEIDDILKRINEKYAKSNISRDEAVDVINQFNSQSSFKEDYVPAIQESDDSDVVEISITTRDENSVSALQEKLENHKLTKLIIDRLKELGVAYDFVGKSKYAGRFSTKDAQLANDGLYHLIELAQGGDVNDALVEEAAHLATLSLRNSDLIKRLLSMINENTIRDLFTDDEILKADYSTEDGKLELAGLLVKKAMQQKRILGYGNFLTRVKNFIYGIFSKGILSNIMSDKRLAKMYAEQIANGFLFDNSAVDIENTVKETNIELFSKEPRGAAAVLVKTLNRIKRTSKEISNASDLLCRNLLESVSNKELLNGKNIDDFSTEEIAAVVGTAISNLANVFTENFEECKELTFDGNLSPVQVNLVFSLGEIYSNISDIYDYVKDYIDSYKDQEGFEVFNEFSKNLDSLRTFLQDKSIPDKIMSFYRASTAQEIEEILGSDVYKESARLIFDSFGKLGIREETKWSAAELAVSYIREKPYTQLSRLLETFRHPANSSDIGTQLFYQEVRSVRYYQSQKYNEALASLSEIEEKCKKAGLDVDDFFERLDDGTPSGNFISPKNYAKYEDQKLEIETQLKEKFLRELKENDLFDEFMKMTKQQKYSDWIIYRNDSKEYQDFLDRTHDDEDHNILSDEFDNERYQELCKNPDFKEILQNIRDWKKRIDDTCLTERLDINDNGATFRHADSNRVPMFSKKNVERSGKRDFSREDLYKSDTFKDYCLDVTSDNFGSLLTDTKLTPFNDEYSLMYDGVRRIPLYGINKLKDMSELSTDLFRTLSMYANMAYKYSTTQEVYAKMMMFNKTLSERNGAINERFKNVSDEQREKLINQFIAPKNEKKNFWTKLGNTARTIGSLVAIRVLSFSYMSALKNYFGGARVVFNDAAAGNIPLVFNGERIEIPISSVTKMFGKSLNPKHFIRNVGSIILNKELTWDKYKNLVRRWDAARNPHIQIRSSKNNFKKLYNWSVNIMMANFSTTDDALIAMIYNSFMNSINVYDAKTRKKVSLTDTKNGAYKFGPNDTPILKDGLIKDLKDIDLYNLLTAAKKEVEDLIFNNNKARQEAEADGTQAVYKEIDDPGNKAILALAEYIENNDLYRIMPDLFKNDRLNSSDKVLEAIKDKIQEISFTQNDEVNICEQINDYIASSQGLYGALNANALMSDANLAMFARLKGWLFGFMQRWFFSNPSALNGDYKSSILESEALALTAILGNNKSIFEQYDDDGNKISDYNLIDDIKFRSVVLLSVCIPFVLNLNIFGKKVDDKTSRRVREYLMKKGWSPDQLSKLSFMCIGFWLQQAIHYLSRRLFSRGNYNKYGKYIYKSKENRKGKKKELEEAGLIFKTKALKDSIKEDLDESNKRWMMWKKQGFPKVLNARKNIESVYRKDDLPPIKQQKGGEVYYVESKGKYYRAKVKDNRAYKWEEVDYGYYDIGSEEFNEHEQAIHYMNYYYEKDSFAYRFASRMYRLSRAVEDEGDALVNPLRIGREIMDIANPIGVSAGLLYTLKLVKTAANEGFEPATKKELNFWLKKFGLEIDGDGGIFLGDENSDWKTTYLDWYNTQDAIDRFNESKWYR